MKYVVKSLLGAMLLLSLSACQADYSNLPMLAPSARGAEVDPDKVRLQAGDTVTVTVYQEEAMTGPRTVDAKGNITLPLIGDVHAAGMTREELKADIEEQLVKKGFLKKPYVTVDVATFRPIYILGEVKNPGSYPYQPTLDAFKAIALAGGYTPRAAENKIVISRTTDGEKKRYRATEDSSLLPGDSIMVEQRFF